MSYPMERGRSSYIPEIEDDINGECHHSVWLFLVTEETPFPQYMHEYICTYVRWMYVGSTLYSMISVESPRPSVLSQSPYRQP